SSRWHQGRLLGRQPSPQHVDAAADPDDAHRYRTQRQRHREKLHAWRKLMASPTIPFSDQEIAQQAAGSGGRATTILELRSGIAWRSSLRRAKFRGARFHVDT